MTKTYNYIQEAINDKHLVMYQKYLLVLQTAHHIIATSLAISNTKERESWGEYNGMSSEEMIKLYDDIYPSKHLLEMQERIKEIQEYFMTEIERIKPSN